MKKLRIGVIYGGRSGEHGELDEDQERRRDRRGAQAIPRKAEHRRERDRRNGFTLPSELGTPGLTAATGGEPELTIEEIFALMNHALTWADVADLLQRSLHATEALLVRARRAFRDQYGGES